MKGGYSRSQPSPSVEQGFQSMAPLPQGGGALLGDPSSRLVDISSTEWQPSISDGCVFISIDLQAMFA